MDIFKDGLEGDLQKIAEVAGMEAAVKIGKAFKGTYLYINGFEQLRKKVRDEQIRRAYEAGERVRTLCVRYGLTERQIRRILNEADRAVSDFVIDLLRD